MEYDQLSPDRLCDAAEAALRAAAEAAAYTGYDAIYPPDLMGSAIQPEYLTQYTKWEVEQASDFLVRLGLLEPPRARRGR